ncbi:type II toxin-antitoxin system PemK/MazF family toxin [Salinarimonas sp. NSM]|uniref:type II toxin-antitoxin system PemK/MazF family toxin n=1 Tax=Salinarimonas sp. NSM TaxID=3458003 RepID=UPI004036A0FB
MAARSTDARCPDSGDIVWLDFDPQAGHEQASSRPALVLSPLKYNQLAGLCVVCPITSRERAWRFRTALPPGLKTSGFVIADQMKSLAWAERRATFIERAPETLMADVKAKLKALLAL